MRLVAIYARIRFRRKGKKMSNSSRTIAKHYVIRPNDYEEQSAELLDAYHGLPKPTDLIEVAGIGAKVPLHVTDGFFVAKVEEVRIKGQNSVHYRVRPTTFISYGTAQITKAMNSGKQTRAKKTYLIGKLIWVTGNFANLIPV